ncbi:penicillin-binding protein 2 [Campylobacter sp. faydin G-105]|uniref:peptidoglycan D,D-transpeptidase FtsI family protein n=1 Tax=Campylobacter anatolicus TaxID=2829105 RepID=UPI001B9B84EE|nr:penicillin-binding protein 2 [Campylobacter anatolicus]MBR8462105.1 penicillin-binding protein 2 [Campylobacter anatolicus]
MNSKKSKITILFIFITLGILLFVSVIFYRATIERRLPRLQTSEINTALRGNIITKDGFSVSSSQKLYKVMVDTRNIDPNKKDMFIKLYSLYSGDDPTKVRKIINSTKGQVTLSYKIDAKGAVYLQELARKLNRKSILISYQDPKTGLASFQGMSIVESGESRGYMTQKALTPALGYVKKVEKNGITKTTGVKGVEKFYEDFLAPIQDAKILGPRDIGSNIILTSDSNLANRIDGYNAVLSIPLKFQTKIEQMLDERKEFLNTDEIVICIMDSKTGKILSLASSSRYDPSNIKKQDYSALNSTATEYAYEIGSVFKPFIFALLLEEKKVNPLEIVNTYNGRYQLGKRIIKDSHPEPSMSAEDIITYSSNIGMIQLAQRLDGTQIYKGLLGFGFSRKSGIDMPYEQVGMLPTVNKLNSSTYKATVSYGYGLQATFMQLLKAYNAFNNKGIEVIPHIVDYLEKNGKKFEIPRTEPQQIISQETAKVMKRILIKVVEKGTGQKTYTPGLEIGGKTGTAHIASGKGGYSNNYNGSFFGFVNDTKGNSYTIGVLARNPKKPYYYFGAQSALPTFKKAVDIMIEDGYLVPDAQIIADLEAKKDKQKNKKNEKQILD